MIVIVMFKEEVFYRESIRSHDFISISHRTSDISRYVCGSVIIRAALFFANQFHIVANRNMVERKKERKKEKKGCEFHRSVAKMESRKKTCVLQVRHRGA